MKLKALALSCATLAASDPWTTHQKWAQGVYLTLTTYDMLQTLKFRSQGGHESNPFLGREPSRAKVVVGIAGAMALHTLVSDALPSDYRKYWQYVWIGVESHAVSTNYRLGVRVAF